MDVKRLLNTDKRTLLIRKNIFFSFLIKGWSGLVIFLSVPLTLACLGEYNNGVWLTISSLLIWIDNMDIGLGNGLRNKLAECIATNNTKGAKEAISSTLAMLAIIIIPLSILLTLGLSGFNIYEALNVDVQYVENLNEIVQTVVLLTCTTFVFKFVGNIYLALQQPAVNNLLITAGQTLALIGTFIIYISDSHSLLTIALVNTCTPLIVYSVAYIVTFYHLHPHLKPGYKYFKITTIKELCKTSLKFFMLQMAGLILFFSSNLIISHIFTPAEVTPYQIAYRYFSIILLAFTIIGAPYWSATTDAYARNDIEWIRTSQKRLQKIVLFTIAGITIMTIMSDLVYSIWIGEDTYVSPYITIGMASYMTIVIWSMSYCYFLNGMGLLFLQLICTIGAAVLFIPASYLASRLYNDVSVVLFTLALINTPSLIVNIIQFNKVIKNTATGIWIK